MRRAFLASALWAIAAFVGAEHPASAQCSEWSPQFAALGVSGGVDAFGVFDDGTGLALYVGGAFINAGGVPANRIARWDGTAWSAIGNGSTDGTNNDVYALAKFTDPSGQALFVGGDFTLAGGGSARGIARWDGTSWSAVGGGTNLGGSVNALAVWDSGHGPELYAGGSFTTAGGIAAANLARWNGSNWSSVAGGTNGAVSTLCEFDDGSGSKLYVGGSFTSVGGVPAANLARFDGSNWSAVTSGTNGAVAALTVFQDINGKSLYVGGAFTQAGGLGANHIARWSGSSWSALASGTSGNVAALSTFNDGSATALFVGGNFSSAGGVSAAGIARWNNGMWSGLGNGVDLYVSVLSVYDDGGGARLFTGGFFTTAGTAVAKSIAEWNGSSWSGVGSENRALSDTVRALTLHDAGGGPELYAGGYFKYAGELDVERVARWDGTRWRALGSGLSAECNALCSSVATTGNVLYAGGNFTTAGGVFANHIARWNGTSWSGVGTGFNDRVFALAEFDDGSGLALYAGGAFTLAGGTSVSHIAKWNGTSWSALASGLNDKVYALSVFDDGSGPALFAGGAFTSAGVLPAARIAKWNGTSWSNLGLGIIGSVVNAFGTFDDGSGSALFVGGQFSAVGAVPAANIARWDGVQWTTLGLGIDAGQSSSSVAALKTFDDGSGSALYAGGYFASAGGASSYGIARWSGSSWSALASGVTPAAYALASYDDGLGGPENLYAGGAISYAGGLSSNFVAEWTGCGASASPFCFGDGTGTPCPCNNSGDPGHGCANSVTPSGAQLSAAGHARVSNDTFMLTVGQVAAPSIVIFYQGSVQVNGGLGLPFGDGLACLGGNALRLRTEPCPFGIVSYPSAGEIPISISGQIPLTGGTRYYGAVYRDNTSFCTLGTYNSSNALAVTWLP